MTGRHYGVELNASADVTLSVPDVTVVAGAGRVHLTGVEFRKRAATFDGLPVNVHISDVSDDDSYGPSCAHDEQRSQTSEADCFNYVCEGTTIKSVHGQFVTVVAKEAINLTEVRVLGSRTRCKYCLLYTSPSPRD